MATGIRRQNGRAITAARPAILPGRQLIVEVMGEGKITTRKSEQRSLSCWVVSAVSVESLIPECSNSIMSVGMGTSIEK